MDPGGHRDQVLSHRWTRSSRTRRFARAAAAFLRDPDAAFEAGLAARQAALERYGLKRFLADWDLLLEEVIRR